MKFDLQAQTLRFVTAGKAKLQSVRSSFATRISAISQFLRLQLKRVTKLHLQSTLLQLLALGATALMVVLAIGGIQTIARGNWSTNASRAQSTQAQQSSQSQFNWAGLPSAASKSAQSAKAPAKAALEATPGKSSGAAAPKATRSATSSKSASKPAVPQAISPVPSAVLTESSLSAFAPQQESAPADPTNYGDRYAKDVFGKPANYDPLIVLHETVGSADSAINTFRTPHRNENQQSSYHSIIRRDGTIVYIVPPEKRAFGAGNSVFKSSKGQEAVKTHLQFPPSVNNFAYHISLETPSDGANDAEMHSGYTDAQYRSLAWLIAHTNVPNDRITTHQAIDRSSSRIDPRSFDASKLFSYLNSMPRPYLEQSAGG